MPSNAAALRPRAYIKKPRVGTQIRRFFRRRSELSVRGRVVIPTADSGKLSFFRAQAIKVLKRLNGGVSIQKLKSGGTALKYFLAVGCSVKQLKKHFSAKDFYKGKAVLNKEVLSEFGVKELREAGYQSEHFAEVLPLQGMLKAKFTLEELSHAYNGRKLVSGLMRLKKKGVTMPVIGKVKVLQNKVLTVENFNRYLREISEEKNISSEKLRKRKWTRRELARHFIFRIDLIKKLGYTPKQLEKAGLVAISPYNLRKSDFKISNYF